MKLLVASIFVIGFNLALADEDFCKKSENDGTVLYESFNVKFCFGSEDFMKEFALKLYDERIPYVVYSNGNIGYRSEDKARVQEIGDALVGDYLESRMGKGK